MSRILSSYRRLPRWAQWTIPIVLVLLIISAASSSSSKSGQGHEAKSVAKQAGKLRQHASGWPKADGGDSAKAASGVRYGTSVDAVCARLQKQYGKREAELAAKLDALNIAESLQDRQEAIQMIDVLTVITSTRTGRLQALSPPDADKSEVAAMIANRRKEVGDLKTVAETVADATATGSSKPASEALEIVKSDNEEYAEMVKGI
jgi:hypothetical protein